MSESRKRGGEEEQGENTSKRVAPSGGVGPAYDVVLIVDGHKFHCVKEVLASHSPVLNNMFYSNFAEKNKKEITLGYPVDVEGFQLFLDAIDGQRTITDEKVEKVLTLASYLESPSFENSCLEFLASEESMTSLKEQFILAEKHHSENLMKHVLSSIKDKYVLDNVIPHDFDSFCNTTKNMVLQRSFELHGIRRPPLPPQPQNPDQEFEMLMDEFMDQVEVQHQHGMTLCHLGYLISDHVGLGVLIDRMSQDDRDQLQNNPRAMALMDELRHAHCQMERNSIRAQLQVIKKKYSISKINDEINEETIADLAWFPDIISRNTQNRYRTQHHLLGDDPIDRMYRQLVGRPNEHIKMDNQPNTTSQPKWVRALAGGLYEMRDLFRNEEQHFPIPPNLRNVANHVNFQIVDEYVRNMRKVYYNPETVTRIVQDRANAEQERNQAQRNRIVVEEEDEEEESEEEDEDVQEDEEEQQANEEEDSEDEGEARDHDLEGEDEDEDEDEEYQGDQEQEHQDLEQGGVPEELN